MKKHVLWILGILLATNASAQQTIVLPDVQKPHQVVVKGNDIYIFDEADYSLHVFTLSPFSLKMEIGQKGEGPQDFKYLPFVHVRPQALACTDFTKTVWFSKDGKVLKIKPYTELESFDINEETLVIPIGERFVKITADHAAKKRHVALLGPDFRFIKELYEGPFVWRTDAPIFFRTDVFCYEDRIVISDDEKGFHFMIFDDRGKHLRTIDKSQDVEKVPNKPLLHQYCVSSNKIYATTYKKKDERTEMIVMNMRGRILKRLHLPLTSIRPKRGVVRYDLFTVDGEKLYELVENKESGKWELLITDLKKAQ